MEKARELLKGSSRRVALISDYLGCSSSSHFNRIFRQLTGMTPGRYRRKG